MVEKNIVKLICEECGGIMALDSNQQVMLCPFCGSKKIILESDNVKIAKAELEKRKIDKDIEIIKNEKEKSDDKLSIIGIIIAIIVTLLLIKFF